jgi:hypothetical protein
MSAIFDVIGGVLKVLLTAAASVFIVVVGYHVVGRLPAPDSAPRIVVEEAKRTFFDFRDLLSSETAS